MSTLYNINRRDFLKLGLAASTGLTLGFSVAQGDIRLIPTRLPTTPTAALNAFVRINSDNTVTIIIKHLEMGQGVTTGLATLAAEELDADWAQIRTESAPANAKLYRNLLWGPFQGTGGSTAIANSYRQMREAGATARAMLVQAAAQQWQVPAGEITVSQGILRHLASQRQASLGELAELASQQPVPTTVPLKNVADFKLIGTVLPRQDNADKINGTALYTLDVQLPNLLVAVVAHPPRFGAKLKSFNADKTKTMPGVVGVVAISTGVAVLARDFWSAYQGRQALQLQWDEHKAFKLSSAELLAYYQRLAQRPGLVAKQTSGMIPRNKAFKTSAQTLQASYSLPYLAHAAMEPMNCVMQWQPDTRQVGAWYGCQSQTLDQKAIAKVFKKNNRFAGIKNSLASLKPYQVKINTLYAGGSFGRRASSSSDFVVETAEIVKAIDGKAPVKLVWSREDDLRAGAYRPAYYHTVKAALDTTGKITAWEQRIVGQSILEGTLYALVAIQGGVDQTSVEGAANLPYTIPHLSVQLHSPKIGVPVLWWRSVGSSHTAFVVETVMDELATLAQQDPVEFRRQHLHDKPRHLQVLNRLAEQAGWNQPITEKNRGRGIALHESFNTVVGMVVEVTVAAGGEFAVDRVVIVVDCGLPINPDVIVAQMEGGMGFGLAAALSGKISFKEGAVEQSNFNDYPILRFEQMPKTIEVHIIPSTEPPTGVGEPATPVIAPALANALFAATGKRYRNLPLGPQLTAS